MEVSWIRERKRNLTYLGLAEVVMSPAIHDDHQPHDFIKQSSRRIEFPRLPYQYMYLNVTARSPMADNCSGECSIAPLASLRSLLLLMRE